MDNILLKNTKTNKHAAILKIMTNFLIFPDNYLTTINGYYVHCLKIRV